MDQVVPVFCGFDAREAVGFHAFSASIIENSTVPVAIIPLSLSMLTMYKGGQRDGTNAFIYSRFLIPYLMGWKGHAIFMDGADMVVKGDIAELWAMRQHNKAVQVVKHDYKTKHPRKYVGTKMEADNRDYPGKNHSSVMLINCAHYGWRDLTPDVIEKSPGHWLHQFQFIRDRYPQDPERFVGELPIEWNWLADEYGLNDEAKLLHWTAGIPAWSHYKNAPHAGDWFHAHEMANEATD